ncbi:unnamed protein product [Umbelopsis sp. WA50703]
MDTRRPREPPFIDSPEQTEGKTAAHNNAQVQDEDQERTHPEHDVVDTWHMGSDVPTVLERHQSGRSDTAGSS